MLCESVDIQCCMCIMWELVACADLFQVNSEVLLVFVHVLLIFVPVACHKM